MIIWSGRGFLSVLVFLATCALCAVTLPKNHPELAITVAFFVTAIFSWIFGKKWNNNEVARTVIDEKTNQRILLKRNHSLFWIPMQYWGIIFGVLGVIMLIKISLLASIITGVVLLLLVLFGSVNINKNSVSQINNSNSSNSLRNSSVSNNSAKQFLKKEPKISTEKHEMIETIDLESEKLKRRQEKEDPSRFMPQ